MSDQSFGYSGKNTESESGKQNINIFSHRRDDLKQKRLLFFNILGAMLKIAPAEIITFTKVGNELVGTVDICNIVKCPITYKVNIIYLRINSKII